MMIAIVCVPDGRRRPSLGLGRWDLEPGIFALIVVLGIPVFFFRDLAKEEPDNCRHAGMAGGILGFWTAAIGVTVVLMNPPIDLLAVIGPGYGAVGLTVGTVAGILAGRVYSRRLLGERVHRWSCPGCGKVFQEMQDRCLRCRYDISEDSDEMKPSPEKPPTGPRLARPLTSSRAP